MNRLFNIMCLRPVVDSLVATVAAILLCGSNHTDAHAPQGIGIMYLTPSDQAGDPIHDLSGDPEWTNPAVQGVSLRTQWARVEPHEQANADDFYWGYLDQGMALGAAYGKNISILITAGVSCPQWLFDAGSPAFNVTTQSGYSAITDGVTTAGSTTMISAGDTASWKTSVSVGLQIFGDSIPTGATIVTVNSTSNITISAPATQSATGVAITTAQILPMPLPWDPIFQQKWGAFIQAFAARYGNAPNLAYVVMGGPGRQEESYFCFTPNDMDYFINTLGGLPNWEQGVKWIIDQYGTYFPNTPVIMAMADPIPTTDGDNSLKTVVNYGVAQHPGNHFGVMSSGLQYPNGPDNGSMGATEIPLLSPTSTVGYQFYQTQHEDIDPVTGRFMLDLGLERGVNFGAHFIEVYRGDCDDPVLAPVLTAWGARMTATPPIPPASTNVPSDFNNDSHSDYLLYNSTTGQTVIYYMNNNVQMSSTYGPTLPGGWQVAAVGDFNRDSHPDYLLFNPATRQTVIWYVNNNIYLSGISGPTPPDGWSVVAASDFNLDGYPDYLLYNANTGSTVIWYMRNNVQIGSASGPIIPGGWQVAAVGDFNRDSHPDYLLFNPATGETVVYYMNNNIFTVSTYGPTLPGGWSVAGVADFNLDGYPDYLLYNANTGSTVIWYMLDNVNTGSTSCPTVPGGWIPVAP